MIKDCNLILVFFYHNEANAHIDSSNLPNIFEREEEAAMATQKSTLSEGKENSGYPPDASPLH